MEVRPISVEPLSERQLKSGVFDVDYAALEENKMPEENRKLSPLERERKMREEDVASRQSRTKRMKTEMNQDTGDGVKRKSTRFGMLTGAGAVNASEVSDHQNSEAVVTVTAEKKQELQKQGVNVEHLEEGTDIPLGDLNWGRPEDQE